MSPILMKEYVYLLVRTTGVGPQVYIKQPEFSRACYLAGRRLFRWDAADPVVVEQKVPGMGFAGDQWVEVKEK